MAAAVCAERSPLSVVPEDSDLKYHINTISEEVNVPTDVGGGGEISLRFQHLINLIGQDNLKSIHIHFKQTFT